MRVTDRHRSVSVLFLHHELSHRLANDIAATEDHTFLTGGLDMIMLQKREDAERRSRDKARQADSHTTDIDGMEAIHIFLIVDSHDDLLLIDMLREGSCTMKPSTSVSLLSRSTQARSSSSVTSSS